MPSPSSNSVPCGGREGDFLLELNAYIKLTDTTRLFLLGSLTQHLSDGSTEGEVGVHLDVPLKPILRRELRQANWERDRYLWVRFGYRLLGTRGHTDDPSTEHRGILEATAHIPLPAESWLVNRALAVESYDRRHEDRQPSRKHENGIGLVRNWS